MSKLDRIYLWILAVGLVVFLIGAFSFLRGAPQTTIKGGMFGTAGQRPSACSTGDIYIETDATSGKRLRVCTATNTWDQLAVIAANSITSASVDTSIALTGTDINTSNQVTATHLAAALPIAQGGTGNTAGVASVINFGTTSAPACTSGGTTTFLGEGAGIASLTEALTVRFVAPVAMTLKTLRVKIGGNVPSGQTAAFKVSVNGSTTSTPTCSVGAAASTCADTSTTKVLAAGDLVDMSLACSGGTGALTASVSATILAQ